MLIALRDASPVQSFLIRAHVGNYSLFITGIFHETVQHRSQRGAPDVVDVFRKPSELPGLVEEAIAAGAKAIWFQYGVVNDAAIARAVEAGLDVVVDRCMKVEYARFHGGLATAGLNSGVITSRRLER